MFVGPKSMPGLTKHSMFTPIRQTRDRDPMEKIIDKARLEDWRSYPVKEIHLEKDLE